MLLVVAWEREKLRFQTWVSSWSAVLGILLSAEFAFFAGVVQSDSEQELMVKIIHMSRVRVRYREPKDRRSIVSERGHHLVGDRFVVFASQRQSPNAALRDTARATRTMLRPICLCLPRPPVIYRVADYVCLFSVWALNTPLRSRTAGSVNGPWACRLAHSRRQPPSRIQVSVQQPVPRLPLLARPL
jgi:hypothetical protein